MAGIVWWVCWGGGGRSRVCIGVGRGGGWWPWWASSGGCAWCVCVCWQVAQSRKHGRRTLLAPIPPATCPPRIPLAPPFPSTCTAPPTHHITTYTTATAAAGLAHMQTLPLPAPLSPSRYSQIKLSEAKAANGSSKQLPTQVIHVAGESRQPTCCPLFAPSFPQVVWCVGVRGVCTCVGGWVGVSGHLVCIEPAQGSHQAAGACVPCAPRSAPRRGGHSCAAGVYPRPA